MAIPIELSTALSIDGMNLEQFQNFGAPSVARLTDILNGEAATVEEVAMMGQALSRMRATGRDSF